jgi:hypothetical protein
MVHLIHLPKYWMKLRDRITRTLRTALCWFITQRVVVVPCRRFGTTCRLHLQYFFGFLNPSDGIRGTETSVRTYHYTLRNRLAECSSYGLCGGSLKTPSWILLVACLCAHLRTEGCKVFWDVSRVHR